MSKLQNYNFTFTLNAEAKHIWPLIADTNRLNKLWGIGPVKFANQAMHTKIMNLNSKWVEKPFEWEYPNHLSIERSYIQGPFKDIAIEISLFEHVQQSTTRTECTWHFTINPRNKFIASLLQLKFHSFMNSKLEKIARVIEKVAMEKKTIFIDTSKVKNALLQGKLNQGLNQLLDAGITIGRVTKLRDFIMYADDLDLARMRPFQIADDWNEPRIKILEMFLEAIHVGILEARWEMQCAMCKQSPEQVKSLIEMKQTTHCNACNMDTETNFEHTVELTCSLSSTIRPVLREDYCFSSPLRTPHIVIQQKLHPHERKSIQLQLSPGMYELRCKGLTGVYKIEITKSQNGIQKTHKQINLHEGVWDNTNEVVKLQHGENVILNNTGPEELLAIIMNMQKNTQAVTASQATTIQKFRDLFAEETLAPGREIKIGTITILFTDLKGSTKLYQEIGDAKAFNVVMSHFDLLKNIITEENGSIVKTIGDAVMGVFTEPERAIMAMIKAQQQLKNPPKGMRPLALKAGIHMGTCIGVNLNNRLDYFGSTINFAARLEGQSNGENIILSDEVARHQRVQLLLKKFNIKNEVFAITLKGFENSISKLHKLSFKTEEANPIKLKNIQKITDQQLLLQ